MHKVRTHNPILLTALVLALLLLLPLSTSAETMQSGTYQVRSGSFGSGGAQETSSETHQQSGVFGETIAGDEGTSASYQSGGGTTRTHGTGTGTGTSTPPSSPPPQTQPSSSGGGGGGIPSLIGQTNNTDVETSEDTPADNDAPSADNRDTGIDNIATAIGALGDGFFGDGTHEYATGTRSRSVIDEQGKTDRHESTPLAYTWHDWLWLAFILLILFLFLLFWKRRKEKEGKNKSDDTNIYN